MTSITGSPTPKPRAGRNNHRQTKSSSSFIPASNQLNAKHNAQQPNPHFHNNHQLPPNIVSNRGSSRSSTGVMSPPQTPKTQQFPNADGKRRKNKKQGGIKQEKTKFKNTATQILASFSSVPVPVEIDSPPASSDEFTSGQITPPKLSSTPPSKAYAGPTFHTSPAPSALPMPKFFSKSVPAGTSLQTMMESDTRDATTPASAGWEQSQSQLEILFRAAREENMGMKRQSSGSSSSGETTSDSSSATRGLDPESPIRNNRRITRNFTHESGLFSMDELDKPVSPTYKQRINQNSSVTTPARMPMHSLGKEEERRKMETANALKQFLLAPQSPVRKTSVSPPSPASRVQNRPSPPQFKAGPPLSPTQNAYQSRSPRLTGYFPLFPLSPMNFPYEPAASPVYNTTPRGSAASYRSSFHIASQQFAGTPQSRLYHNHNNHNSILASKLEAAKATTVKSVTDLENDLRRVLMI